MAVEGLPGILLAPCRWHRLCPGCTAAMPYICCAMLCRKTGVGQHPAGRSRRCTEVCTHFAPCVHLLSCLRDITAVVSPHAAWHCAGVC